MGRLFVVDGSTNDFARLTAQGLTTWTFGTVAAVIYQTSAAAAYTIIEAGTTTEDLFQLYSEITTHPVSFWNKVDAKFSTTAITLNEWMLIACTKATGTTTPRAHLFRWSTGTWTHQNMTGTLADSSGTASEWSIGLSPASPANSWNGHVLAAACWPQRVWTDSEIERLAGGLWDRWSPGLLMEFPSGRDGVTRTTVDMSRNRMRQSAVGSQVSRSNIAGPPGFRMSAWNRRR